MTRMWRAAAVVATALLLAIVLAIPAGAAKKQRQDGLVNVAIGDITIRDVNVGIAALVAANVCGVKVGPIAVLAVQVDRSGRQRTVCTIQDNDIVLKQN